MSSSRLTSDIASACSAGKAAKPTRASTALSITGRSGSCNSAALKVSRNDLLQVSGRGERLVKNQNVLTQFLPATSRRALPAIPASAPSL